MSIALTLKKDWSIVHLAVTGLFDAVAARCTKSDMESGEKVHSPSESFSFINYHIAEVSHKYA